MLCVVSDGCVHVFMCASDAEFPVAWCNRCTRVMEGVVKGLLLVVVFLVLLIRYDGAPVNKIKRFLMLSFGGVDL